ncbi:MAG: hypothetical protein IIC51_03305 [Planctomycetes bacterium]|nr:hypothetical protein [Planctomycetota bacterium]
MMSTASATSVPLGPENILALLREQVDLYGELAGYADEQRSLITREDTGPLLAVLAKRQELSSRLGDVVQRLEPVRRDWVTHRSRFDSTQRLEAKDLLADIRSRLRDLIDRDEEDVRMLSARKQAVTSAMRSTHSTGQALCAYRDDGIGTARVTHLDEAS